MELCVLQLCLFVDGDVGICVFPESEEVLIGLSSGGLFAHHHLGASELQVCQGTRDVVQHNPWMFDELLELGRGLQGQTSIQKGQASSVDGVEAGQRRGAKFIRSAVPSAATPQQNSASGKRRHSLVREPLRVAFHRATRHTP